MSDERDLRHEAPRIIEDLAEYARRDDLTYEIYVRQAIEAGLCESDAGRVVTTEAALARVRDAIRRIL